MLSPPKYSLTTITQTPLIEESKLGTILKDIYGISDCTIHKLTGYDDLNFKIENVSFNSNANIKLIKRNETTFIVKFTNPLEASNPLLLDGQTKLTAHLRSKGIPCAETLPTIDGSLWKIVNMTDEVTAPIRLFQFLPGLMLEKIGYNDTVYSLMGRLVADFHNATSDFSHPAYENGWCHFMCNEDWDTLEEELHHQIKEKVLTDKSQIDLCQKGFDDFRNDVISQRETLKIGFIHSDVNETNVLLQEISDGKYEITGLLDFGDTHKSYLICDIAALILYLAVDANEDNWRIIAKSVLKGYCEKRKPEDLEHILVSMRARLVSSLVYALRTIRINYRNEDPTYILKMQANGWRVLDLLTKEYDSNQRSV
uniref:Hydroxylysine kinase n=1 Tax=Panagrolaimus davidi TaxID=227884 RepID=A0A914QUW0_9BILA